VACEADNDPQHLVRTIAEALVDADLADDDSALPESLPAGCVVVLDGLQAIKARESLAVIAELIERADAGGQVVLASRSEPALRLGGLRAERKLVELRPADLAMSTAEAAALVATHGLLLDRAELETLVRRTEGWPAALYLATLAAREERHPARALADFAGDDRFVADYVDDELLASLDPQQVAFLARTSVLGTLSGPVCDFVLERADSARVLKRLSRTNLMLVPLDRSDDEYRYHRLFAQALRAELRRSEPTMEATLHRRASTWYGDHGDIERSIEHAVAAGDLAHAGELIWSHTPTLLGFGQAAQLRRWLSEFSEAQLASCATLALAAAAYSLMAGDRNLVEHWTSVASRCLESARSGPERRALQAQALLLRTTVADDRVGEVGELARSAAAELPNDSPWLGLACLAQGVARHLIGERELARQLLEEGARRSAATSPSIQALCLAQLGLLAIERRDWAAAESLTARAKAQVERSGAGDYPTSALVYALASDVEAQLGRVEGSQSAARHAKRLLGELVDLGPWYEAECRIALARASLRLGDARHARELLTEASRRLQRAPDAQVALDWIGECQEQAEQSSSSSPGRDWSLTTAELRVLQFLPTHLSFPDIADAGLLDHGSHARIGHA
jgi:LuxR family maltose regulon positive regulatory protein